MCKQTRRLMEISPPRKRLGGWEMINYTWRVNLIPSTRPSLFEFQSDTGEYDLRIIPKCPTSGVWAELYVGTSLHVRLLLESRTAGSGARRVVFSTSQDQHRQILPFNQVMFKPGKHPCSYPRRLHQSTGADDPPRSGLQSGHH
jgi:hypothetical protein